jgi:hypothetical protein
MVNFKSKIMNYKLLFSVLFTIVALMPNGILAQKVEFTAKAPNAVVSGQPFQLQYIVNSEGAKNLQIPKIDDFQIVAGPNSFTSSSYQFINGKASSSVSVTYTYMLLPQKEGTFTISPASITVEGEQHKSNSLTIKVLPPDSKPQNQQGNSQQSNGSAQVSNEDVFILPIISRTNMREQEMVLLTYKIYHLGNLVNITDLKFPDFKGLMMQEIEIADNKRAGIENYKGRNYETYIIKQMLISPQHSGEIEISPMTMSAVLRIKNRVQNPRSFFDDFFTYQDVKKTLSSGRAKLNVTALPQPKPADFSGAVGSLSMTSEISTTELEANSAVTLKITIKGTGNLKLIKTPDVKFPTDFEKYEPKTSNNFSVGTTGFSGSKVFEYLTIPRYSGTFKIPPITLTYFDLPSNSYKTLTTQEYTLNVAKGSGNQATAVQSYTNQEQVQQIATDIRYIKIGNLKIGEKEKVFTGTLNFYLAYAIPALFAVLLGLFFNKQAKNSANVALMRNKKANKIARKRLKAAEHNLKTAKKEQFYDEILSALWLYLSDKLNLSLAALNKDNITEEMDRHSVEKSLADEFLNLLKNCEFERYAPLSDFSAAMDKIYYDSIKIIEKMESTIKS